MLAIFNQNYTSDKPIRNVKSRIYSFPVHVHRYQLYYLEQHSKSFNIWSATIRSNTEGKSLNMKLGHDLVKRVNTKSVLIVELYFTSLL